ncbi:MAG: abortive phage infection protein [Clostridiales bacterium]|nr:abortive phage infection protein [Clostridiales bacterium]
MVKMDQLFQLLEEGNGYIKTSDALSLDVSAPYFYDFVADLNLMRVGRGLYKTEDAWDDELYVISALNKQVCFSHETALYLNELMEREPFEITVTAPRGYNAAHLRKRKIRVFQVDKEKYLLGKTELSTPFGNVVAAYDKERAICDLLRNKDNTDIQIFQVAFKLYFERKDKNIPLLMQYAGVFNIEESMRKYTEVLL